MDNELHLYDIGLTDLGRGEGDIIKTRVLDTDKETERQRDVYQR